MKQGGGQQCPPLLYCEAWRNRDAERWPAKLGYVSLGKVLPQ
jgi:hypothetical protein